MEIGDKKMVVFYCNVEGKTTQIARKQINDLTKKLNEKFTDVVHYVVPIEKGENRMECINPTYIDKDEYTKIQENLEAIKTELLNG